MWNTILNILKNDVVQKILLIGIIGLLIVGLFRQCSDSKALQWQAEQNKKALIDSMHTVKNAMGELAWEKSAFAAKLDDMQKLNRQLYAEAIEINGKVKTLQNVNTQLLIEEIRKVNTSIPTIKHTDSADYYKFLWKENYTKGSFNSFLEGYTTVKHQRIPKDTVEEANTFLTRQQYSLALKTYIYEDKDGYLIGGVAPIQDTPGLTFSLETGVFDPVLSKKFQTANKPQNIIFGIGPFIGVNYGQGYSNNGTYSGVGWSVGIGFSLTYKIFGF